mmetsp:Transcript_43776/g.81710  ORF Transcript_43776/g.81710 Transcript_43776/m.81710 type:complete len:257 (-) Transcript_43776:73-843(-)
MLEPVTRLHSGTSAAQYTWQAVAPNYHPTPQALYQQGPPSRVPGYVLYPGPANGQTLPSRVATPGAAASVATRATPVVPSSVTSTAPTAAYVATSQTLQGNGFPLEMSTMLPTPQMIEMPRMQSAQSPMQVGPCQAAASSVFVPMPAVPPPGSSVAATPVATPVATPAAMPVATPVATPIATPLAPGSPFASWQVSAPLVSPDVPKPEVDAAEPSASHDVNTSGEARPNFQSPETLRPDVKKNKSAKNKKRCACCN